MYSDSSEYLELFYPFTPNDIWRMAITKSERKRVILDKIFDRLELYLSDIVEYYRKEIPSLSFDKWYFERRRHPQEMRRCIAYYDSSDASIHFSLSAFMYGEFELRMIILHEMCHVKYQDHKPHFWKLLFDTAGSVGLNCTSYYDCIKYNNKNQIITTDGTIDYTIISPKVIVIKKKHHGIFPEISKHGYVKSAETNDMAEKAKLMIDNINHNDYHTEKFDYAVTTLWDYTTKGCLRAAVMLSRLLEHAMKYHSINNAHLFYLTQEKMLNMGYHRLHESILDNFYFGEGIEHQYNQKQLDRLIDDGSGLALINKADMLISQGNNLKEAVELYHRAALNGYSVGWRILYCIFNFLNDKKSANSALQHFTTSAQADKTNWRWIEILIDDIHPNSHPSLSIMSKNPQSAIFLLKNRYNNSNLKFDVINQIISLNNYE